jgi:hypothetical protein
VFGVGVGDQACGETGDGRMLEPQELLQDVVAFFQHKVLAGQQVLVSAGPTFEAIDPVRGITNRSSGKMGFAIARAAHEAGADVTLVAGRWSLPTPRGVRRSGRAIGVRYAQSLRSLVRKQLLFFIATAAVADWRPLNAARTRKSRKTAPARPRSCSLPKTPTFWPPWRSRPVRKVGRCIVWVLPPKATTCWPTPRPNASARGCPCWWAILALTPLARRQCPAAGGCPRRARNPARGQTGAGAPTGD